MSADNVIAVRREAELRHRGRLADGPLGRQLKALVQAGSANGRHGRLLMPPLTDANFNIVRGGSLMEDNLELLKAVTESMRAAREEIQKLTNEVVAGGPALSKLLLDELKAHRDSRMVAVREAKETLTAMREIREFFMEKDYDREMARLERLVQLCREFKALKDDGALDVVLEASLRLAAGPESKA